MKKDIEEKIEIPEGVEVQLNKKEVKIKGPEGETQRDFRKSKVELEKENSMIVVRVKKATKKEKKLAKTAVAHLKNMVEGVQNKFEYKLKICSSHFPISVEQKDKEVLIKNFLGEKIARKAKVEKGSEVAIDKDIIIVSSVDKEKAGQTAANLESATKVRKRDLRIFQDGIFMTSKPRGEI